MPFVLDNSITMPWCFEDETSPESAAALERLNTDWAITSAVWPLEVVNALVFAMRRNRVTQARAIQFLSDLQALPITIDGGLALRDLPALMARAQSYSLTAYDASYLELAIREGLPLATLDTDLRAAAQSAGVPLL